MHAMPIGLSPSVSSMNLFTPSSGSASKAAATANGSAVASAASSTGTGLAGTTTGTTFLSLLVDELQNQDPSAPMDSTAMVGQMISLNQLDQLVSINSELGNSSSSSSSSASSSGLPGASPVANSSNQSSSALIAAKNALLSDSSLSSMVNPASLAASNPSTTLDLSSFTNQFGGK